MGKKISCVCIGLLLICSFLSCKQKQAPEIHKIPESKTEKQAENGTTEIENFDAFFERFSKDSVFQKERTKYPLKIAYYEDIDEDLSVRYAKETESAYTDFTADTLAINKKTDRFTFKIEKTDTKIIYKRVGYDNGIYISYIFSLFGNSWFLSEIRDEST